MRIRCGLRVLLVTAAGVVMLLLREAPGRADAPPGRYTVSTDAVVDPMTGLTWQRVDAPVDMNWQAALVYCGGLSLEGHSDWRLPSLKELFTIVDEGLDDTSIDPAAFPGTTSRPFWTSTPYAGREVLGNPGQRFEWSVVFGGGGWAQPVWGGDSLLGGNVLRVRCVR